MSSYPSILSDEIAPVEYPLILQETSYGESESAPQAAIEQIVAEILADANSQAYAFVP